MRKDVFRKQLVNHFYLLLRHLTRVISLFLLSGNFFFFLNKIKSSVTGPYHGACCVCVGMGRKRVLSIIDYSNKKPTCSLKSCFLLCWDCNYANKELLILVAIWKCKLGIINAYLGVKHTSKIEHYTRANYGTNYLKLKMNILVHMIVTGFQNSSFQRSKLNWLGEFKEIKIKDCDLLELTIENRLIRYSNKCKNNSKCRKIFYLQNNFSVYVTYSWCLTIFTMWY